MFQTISDCASGKKPLSLFTYFIIKDGLREADDRKGTEES
jgi:hypothetical protein